VSEQEDPNLILHIVGETKEGAVVRGLRTLATLAPISSAGASDLANDELGPFVDRYLEAAQPVPRNITLARYSRRHGHEPISASAASCIERMQSGDADNMRLRLYGQYGDATPTERMMRFVKRLR
jgi:aromatic ring hydroxylase